ncbi:uncharacterized protein LOC132557864 [Ylistrum balloti]|uniref:uncharacterized protein LOC132557864 n=1 Tax=Ylistrum balloti TaxID=509963 RepID=UPI002905AE9F|nr:uncharacterized protein LOC132557864 [Ylistrum balloti]
MDRGYLRFLITIILSISSLSANISKSENSSDPHGQSCGLQIGCYNVSVTTPLCGSGTVTYSPLLNYTSEFELIGCDGRRVKDAPVSWREVITSTDGEISSCRNQYRCLIPNGIIRRRIGHTLVLDIWIYLGSFNKVVRLGIRIIVRPSVEHVVSTESSRDIPAKPTHTKTSSQRTTTKRVNSVTKYRQSHAKSFDDLILEYLAATAMSSQEQQTTQRKRFRTSKSRKPSRPTAYNRQTVGRLDIVHVIHRKPGTRNQRQDTRRNKLKKNGKSVDADVDRINEKTRATLTLLNDTKSKAKTGNVTYIDKTVKILNSSKLSVYTGQSHTRSNTTTDGINVHRRVKPLNLNIAMTKHGRWTKSGKPKWNVNRKIEIRINKNISHANTALDSILNATLQKERQDLVMEHHTRMNKAFRKDDMKSETQSIVNTVMSKCVKFLCGKRKPRRRCPEILVLQCLHLTSGERRQLVLGELRDEVQQLIDMFNVSKSDLEEIERSAKVLAQQLTTQGGNADTISKKIGKATAEILQKLYNTSYLASKAAMNERLGWSGDTRTASALGLGEWSNWSPCSSSCGKGTAIRSRVCLTTAVDCQNKPSHQTRICIEPTCPKVTVLPQVLSPWSKWSSCSVTCGLGHETRSRVCDGDTGQNAKTSSRDRCKGPVAMTRFCIMSTCNTDANVWRKTVLLGYDTVLSCKSPRSWSSTETFWITPRGTRVSRTSQLSRLYMVGDTLVIHGAQKTDEGDYHCISNQAEPSKVITTDTGIEVLTCASAPCENGGVCQERSHSFNSQLRKVTCSCRNGFGGERCHDYLSSGHFHLYLLISLLIGLLFSSLIGFLVYFCAYRNTNRKLPKKSKEKNDSESQTHEKSEEADVSTNLDSSIIHSDDSWLEISEKDYKDFQIQNVSNLQQRPISRSLPALSSVHPLVERKSVSNTETRSRQDYDDLEQESRTQKSPKEIHGYAYEVQTSPEIKSKILLIKADRKTKSSPNIKAKKTVSFQNSSVNDNKHYMGKSLTSQLPLGSTFSHQLTSATSPAHQVSSSRPADMMSTRSPAHNVLPTRPTEDIPLPSSTHHVSSSWPADKMSTQQLLSNRPTENISAHSPAHKTSSTRPTDNVSPIPVHQVSSTGQADKMPPHGPAHQISSTRSAEISTAGPAHNALLTASAENISTTSALHQVPPTRPEGKISTIGSDHQMSSLPEEDYTDMSAARQTEDGLVIVTSDSILRLDGDTAMYRSDKDVDIVHKMTSTTHGEHNEPEQQAKHSEDDMEYTPVYYTYQPSNLEKDDMYVDMCEFVHKNTYFPEQVTQRPQKEDLYINLIDNSVDSPDSEIPVKSQTEECLDLGAKRSTTTSHQIDEYTSQQTTNRSDYIDRSHSQEDSSKIHETNSSNHSLKDKVTHKHGHNVNDSQHKLSSFDNTRRGEYHEMHTPEVTSRLTPSITSESDDDQYESDQSSTLCPMPDLDDSEVFDDGSWDATLKDGSFDKVDDSANVVESLVKCFEREKRKSIDGATKSDSDLKLRNDTDIMSSTFAVSLGDLLDEVSGYCSTEARKGIDNELSEINHHQQNCVLNNSQPSATETPNILSPSSPRTRMCRGHYEMVYGPVSFPSPIVQLDTISSSEILDMTETETQTPQVYPVEHHYTSKSKSDFP